MATAVACGAHADVLLDPAGWHLLNQLTRSFDLIVISRSSSS
jgi:hypothetical protein